MPKLQPPADSSPDQKQLYFRTDNISPGQMQKNKEESGKGGMAQI